MPIQILWGNDLNAQNTFIQKLIDKEVSKEWKEIIVTNLNGDDDEQVNKAFDEVITPPFGEGCRIVTLKNNPIFTAKNEDLRTKFEKIHDNIPQNTYFILQNTKKPDSRLKSTKFLQKLIKNNLAKEKSFSLPEIWDYEGQKRFLENAANEMNIKMDKNAAELIIDSVGNDSFKLINELAKAKTYLSAVSSDSNSQLFLKSIVVKKIFSDHQSNIFKIIDLLLQKNINESLIEINYSLQKGEPALRLNAVLISQIRIHTIIKLGVNSVMIIQKRFVILQAFLIQKEFFLFEKKSKIYLKNI